MEILRENIREISSTYIHPAGNHSPTINTAEGFGVFYDTYAAALYGEIKRALHKEDICQEVLETTFCKMYSSIDQPDPEKERLFIWALKKTCKEISLKKVDCVLDRLLYYTDVRKVH